MSKTVVTLIGSLHRDRAGLKSVFTHITSGYDLLSPKDIEFIDLEADFVKAEHERNVDVHEIEQRHIQAIMQSDFVWLFAPEGYVGTSAAFELGVAHAMGVPIYTDIHLGDEMLETMITKRVKDVDDIEVSVYKPGAGINGLQYYYDRIAKVRGWGEESARDATLLLVEEIGELARAVRKVSGLTRAKGYNDIELENELADVQLYVVHLANILKVNLAQAVNAKETINYQRHVDKSNK